LGTSIFDEVDILQLVTKNHISTGEVDFSKQLILFDF